jgi:uncharacterized protein DUF5681
MSVENEVGYKKPPKATQFKKGKSGNLKGRPKGSKSITALAEEVIWKLVKIRQDGQRKSVPMIQAMLMAFMAKATQGDIKAADLVFKIMERLQLLPPKSALAPASADKPASFGWTEEDESLRPFLEHLLGESIVLPGDGHIIESDNPKTDPKPGDGTGEDSDNEQRAPPEKPK